VSAIETLSNALVRRPFNFAFNQVQPRFTNAWRRRVALGAAVCAARTVNNDSSKRRFHLRRPSEGHKQISPRVKGHLHEDELAACARVLVYSALRERASLWVSAGTTHATSKKLAEVFQLLLRDKSGPPVQQSAAWNWLHN
jgi:hypothetical protein